MFIQVYMLRIFDYNRFLLLLRKFVMQMHNRETKRKNINIFKTLFLCCIINLPIIIIIIISTFFIIEIMNAFNDSSCKFDKSCIYKLMYISSDIKKKKITKYFD